MFFSVVAFHSFAFGGSEGAWENLAIIKAIDYYFLASVICLASSDKLVFLFVHICFT